jgi:hypothetical protein
LYREPVVLTINEKYRQVSQPLTKEERKLESKTTLEAGDAANRPAQAVDRTSAASYTPPVLFDARDHSPVFIAAAPILQERRRQYEENERRRREEEIRRYEER